MSNSMSSKPWDFDYDDEPSGFYQDGHFYADPSDWYSEHSNPPGTEDCGDGYVDDDGVFYEY